MMHFDILPVCGARWRFSNLAFRGYLREDGNDVVMCVSS